MKEIPTATHPIWAPALTLETPLFPWVLFMATPLLLLTEVLEMLWIQFHFHQSLGAHWLPGLDSYEAPLSLFPPKETSLLQETWDRDILASRKMEATFYLLIFYIWTQDLLGIPPILCLLTGHQWIQFTFLGTQLAHDSHWRKCSYLLWTIRVYFNFLIIYVKNSKIHWHCKIYKEKKNLLCKQIAPSTELVGCRLFIFL